MENIRFHITVKGIVVYNHQVLLLKRTRPSSDGLGYWELPGGGLEYGETPNQFAADAYDAVYIVKAAVEKSGATPADSISDICDKLKTAMADISVDGLTGEAMSWDEDGAVNKAPKAMQIVNGNYSLIQ